MKTATTNPALRGERLLASLATGKLNQEAVESLWLAAQMWLASGGQTSIERQLRLPTTGPKLTAASRDMWYRKAASLLAPNQGPWMTAQILNKEYSTFLTRGPWRSWQPLGQPPVDASELRQALFYVAWFSKGETMSSRQLSRILT
jgi:hypothetical protein